MKKAIFKGFAVAALALAVLFTGCKSETSDIEKIRVNAVEITAKAYPGYNYVTWSKAENDPAATVAVIRDDGTVANGNNGLAGNVWVDTNIKDGVSYKYTAYVTNSAAFKPTALNNNTNNDYSTGYQLLGNSSSDSCTAINPICIKDGKLMTALELCDFEDKGDSDFVINEENIIFEKEANGTAYYVAFPTKQYLSYNVKVYYANEADVFGIKSTDFTSSAASVDKAFYTNDSAVRYTSGVTAPGEYTTVVQVKAINEAYQPSYITAKNKFKVEALDVASNTTIKNAGYVDAGKTIRLIWTPATKAADGKDWEVGKYTVYVQDKLTGVWTALAGTPKATTEEAAEAKAAEEDAAATTPAISPAKDGKQLGKTVYYFDYTVPSNEVKYDFAVVLADNGKVEANINSNVAWSNKKSVNAYAKLDDIVLDNVATVSAAMTEIDNDGKSNDAVLTITPKADSNSFNKKDFKIKSVAYKVIAKNDNATYTASSLLLDSEITAAAAVPSADYTKYDVLAKDIAYDSKVVFLYVLSYKDKADTAFVATTDASTYTTPDISITYPAANTISAGPITATLKTTAADGVQTWKFDYVNSNADDFKKYEYTVSIGKLDPNSASENSVTSWNVVTLAPTLNATKTAYEATKDEDLKSATGYFGKVTNISDNKVTYTDKYILKFTKSLKAVSESAGYDVEYSSVSSAITVQITK